MIKENTKLNAIAIFGGSFDPVQNAHISIINNLADRFYKVIVVPSFISPFKKQGASASGKDRFVMLEAVASADALNRPNIEVSDFEIAKEGTSYTIDTVRHFKQAYPNNLLYFIIGSEMLKKLPKWYNFDELKEFVTFLVVERDGFALSKAVLNRLNKKLGAKVEVADFIAGSEASSAVRVDIAFGNFKNIPLQANSIIKKNNLYNDFAQIVDSYEKFGLGEKRIKHIYGTALTAAVLAKKHNASVHDVTLAALLHDIAKKSDIETIKGLGVNLSGILTEYPDKVAHAFTGADIAKQVFGIKKKAVLDAIRFHTTGSPKMGKLAKILFIADFIEPNREGELYADIREEVRQEKNLNKAVLKILETKISHVEGKGKEVYHLTYEARAHFMAKLAPKISADLLVGLAIEDDESLKALILEGLEGGRHPATPAASLVGAVIDRPHIAVPLSMPAKKQPAGAVIDRPRADKNHLAYKIAKILDDKKGRDITIIDLQEKTIIADYFVIASAFSTTAVRALTDIVDEELSKKMGIEPLRRDIDPAWACVDYGSVILHVQLEETRDFYNLERLWSSGDNVERF